MDYDCTIVVEFKPDAAGNMPDSQAISVYIDTANLSVLTQLLLVSPGVKSVLLDTATRLSTRTIR